MSSFTSSIPKGKATTVRIIDSTSQITNLKWKILMGPAMPGLDVMPPLPTWSFLIEHPSGRNLLFDLGIPTDWEEMAPAVSSRLKDYGWGITVTHTFPQLLAAGVFDPSSIEAIIWSHYHWDHIGNPSHFPPSTKVIVGPGFKNEILPAYPAREDSVVRESDFAGRELHEVTFEENTKGVLKIGPFRALDYFGDGSFYLLDTPGHTTGHISGLARTTTSSSGEGQEDTFIFMGGDLTHHAGELRPSELLPLPEEVSGLSSQLLALTNSAAGGGSTGGICPGAIFESLQTLPDRNRVPSKTTPFFDPTIGTDVAEAIETVKKTILADGDPNVLYIFAHDAKLPGVIGREGFFPKTANDWKRKGWREGLMWRFLEDFEGALKEVQKREKEGGGGKL